MKEKFVLIIESLHEANRGEQDNVSHVVKEHCNYCFAFFVQVVGGAGDVGRGEFCVFGHLSGIISYLLLQVIK
jgi:hypothetical protein